MCEMDEVDTATQASIDGWIAKVLKCQLVPVFYVYVHDYEAPNHGIEAVSYN